MTRFLVWETMGKPIVSLCCGILVYIGHQTVKGTNILLAQSVFIGEILMRTLALRVSVMKRLPHLPTANIQSFYITFRSCSLFYKNYGISTVADMP